MIQPATLTDRKQQEDKMATYFNHDSADGDDDEACSSGSSRSQLPLKEL
jgi:hypothetical protein